MSDMNPQPPPDLEPERLLAALPADAADPERLWKALEARLAAADAAPSQQKKSTAQNSEEPIRRRWWIEVLTGIAAFFLFALMLGDSRRISVKHTPVGDGKMEQAEKADEPDPAPLLEQLQSKDILVRHNAYLALLRGGKKTREAVNAYQAGGHEELDFNVGRLRQSYALVDQLAPLSEKETLAFWQAVWNAEAILQPNIWDVGLDLPAGEGPAPAPSELLIYALQAKYGEAQGLILKGRFAQAFTTLQSFQKWERHKNETLLDSIHVAGIPVAPVVLHILATPEATEITFPRRPGMKGTFPSDHLRMMAAAVKLKLHEAEPFILQFAGGYFSSGTIQANAINALWQLGGRTDRPFPLDIGAPTKEEAEEVQKWWHANHKNDPKGKFDDDINAALSRDPEKSEAAVQNLLRGGDPARAAVRAHPRTNDLERVRKLFEVLATLETDPESLGFWNELWDDEAYLEPWLWAYGIKGEGTSYPALEERAAKPKLLSGTPEVLPALRAKFGDERAQQIAKRFAAAYQAYVNFRHWSRPPMGQPQTAEQNKRLDDMAAAGIAAAPPILKLLSEPQANDIHSREESNRLIAIMEGKQPPLPTSGDHLRMIVAADRMKLRAAEMLLMDKVALGYPMSRTVQEHAVAAIYRLHGDHEIVKHFPFDIATNDTDWFATFFAWWLEEETRSIRDEIHSGDPARVNAAQADSATIQRMLPQFETWRKWVAEKKEFHDVETRLAKAIENFKAANPQRVPGERKTPAPDEQKKREDRW